MTKNRLLPQGVTIAILMLLISCNDNELGYNDKSKVVFSIDPFENESITRTNADPSNNYQVTWASGDVIGIFPREGYQEPFTIPADQVGNSKADFDGGYWSLKDGLTYNAYYPFDKANFESSDMKTQIHVTYENQQQQGNTCSIGSHDYTYSDWNTAGNGKVIFKFHHLGAFAIFHLPIPVTTHYNSLTISTEEAIIPTTGKYSLLAAYPAFEADGATLSKSMSIKLNEFKGVGYENGTVFAMLPPMDLTGKLVTFTLTSQDGGECKYTLPGELIKASKKYEYTLKPISSTVPGTTESWLRDNGIGWRTINIANAGSIASYIHSEEKYNLTNLKVIGNLNGTDILYIREMAGVDLEGLQTNKGNLECLDLSEARIISGGKDYFKGIGTSMRYCTENDVIGPEMFYNTLIKEIKLPKKANSIEYHAFLGCKNLSTVVMPDNLTKIGVGAFRLCTNLKEIVMSKTLSTIEDNAFSECSSLPSIKLPYGLTKIAEISFASCTSLNEILLPSSLNYIGRGAFCNCNLLTQLVLPNRLTTIDSRFIENTGIQEISIPDGVYTTTAFTFDSPSLKTIKVSKNRKYLHTNMLNRADGCKILYLPSSLTNIEKESLPKGLTELYCFASKPPYIENFSNLTTTCKIYVPSSYVSAYKASRYWSDFKDCIYPMPSNITED